MAVQSVGLANPVLQFVDGNGVPYASGTVTFLAAGTNNLQNVYSDAALSVPLTNPVHLNAAGRSSTSAVGADTPVYFLPLPYDFTLKDANGTTIYGPITFSGSSWPGAINGLVTLSPLANANGYANEINPTINKASSGTHALFAGTYLDAPTIGAGAATLTEASTLYIAGPPSAGSAVYPLHVASGIVKFDGDVYSVDWTSYGATSTIIGWASFTTKNIYYKKIGKLVFCIFDIAGTSNATSVTFTLPYISVDNVHTQGALGYAVDNGTAATTPGAFDFGFGANNICTCYLTSAQAAASWTNTGTKEVRGQFFFQSTT